MARILILRERDAARATARDVEAAGHEPVLLPLQAIVPLDASPRQGPFGALIVTSANALRGADLAAFEGLRVLAVGQASAEAARAAGFEVEVAGDGTGAALSERAAELHAQGGLPMLYAAGRVRTGGLERALREAEVPFETIETYDTRDADLEPGAVEAALAFPVDAVLVLSLGQARAYARLLERHPDRLAPPPIPLCLSERIRAGLPAACAQRALVSETPELSALLARYGSPNGSDR